VGLTTVSRIYCGLSRPTGEPVTDDDLDAFVADVLSHEFPDGFSVIHAQGGWSDLVTGRTIREPAAILEVAHGPADMARVNAVARAYKALFGQQAVMIAQAPINVQFV
jgi:hypothetical protein